MRYIQFPVLVLGVGLGLAASGMVVGPARIGRSLMFGGLAFAVGCALIWWRSDRVAAPRLERPAMVTFDATVETVETRPAKGDLRLTLATRAPGLPPRVRVSTPEEGAPQSLGEGARIRLKARLQPPPPIPGSFQVLGIQIHDGNEREPS